MSDDHKKLVAFAEHAMGAFYECAPGYWDTQEDLEQELAEILGEDEVAMQNRIFAKADTTRRKPLERKKTQDLNKELVAMLEEQRVWLVQWCECLGSDQNEPCSFCKRRHEIGIVLKRAKEGERTEREKCTWTEDETHGCWTRSCGGAWVFYTGGPTENKMKFCYFCGKPIRVVEAKGE